MNARAIARQKLLERELTRYVPLLIDHENAEKVIVFGSLAAGNVHEWSDIDLVVIKQTSLPFLKRARAIRNTLRPQVALYSCTLS